jgi:hypothetical protein
MKRQRKQQQHVDQLSLFESNEPVIPVKEPTVLEFVRARFEHGPDMTQEEYKRWIKVLVNHSIKSVK